MIQTIIQRQLPQQKAGRGLLLYQGQHQPGQPIFTILRRKILLLLVLYQRPIIEQQQYGGLGLCQRRLYLLLRVILILGQFMKANFFLC